MPRLRSVELRRGSPKPPAEAALDLEIVDGSLLDVVDNVLNHGVILQGDLTLGLANIDLIYARLALMLAAVDRVDGAPRQSATPAAARKLKNPRRRRR
jgi:hypothetical protein